MILELAKKLEFPTDAAICADRIYWQLASNPTVMNKLYEAMDLLYDTEGKEYVEKLNEVPPIEGVSPYTVHLIFALMCAHTTRYLYIQNGLPESLYWETMMDIRYKLMECHNVHGVWGLFVIQWYGDFFRCKRFKLGRLQYERREFPYESYGPHLKQGDRVYNCHIPSCGPVTRESVMDSLKKAHQFFRNELKDGILPIFCSSWMLYPPHAKKVFAPDSNLQHFYELFDILEQIERPENSDYWRIFNTPYSKEALADAPTDTSLRRSFKQFLQEGNSMGVGKGIFLFDGEQLLPPPTTP